MKTIASIILFIGVTLQAFGADTPFTVNATSAQTNAVIARITRVNASAVAQFAAAHPGVVLSTNGVTVTGTVAGSSIGTMTLKSVLGYAREICGMALDGVVREEATIAQQASAVQLKTLAEAYKTAPKEVQDQVNALLLK